MMDVIIYPWLDFGLKLVGVSKKGPRWSEKADIGCY